MKNRTFSSQNSDKRKSFFLSILLYALLLLILFFIRFWPPSNLQELVGGNEGGVTVNFGDSDLGSGKDFQIEDLEINKVKSASSNNSTPDEKLLSQENSSDESVMIPENKNEKKVVKDKKVNPVVEEKPKVSTNTNDALTSFIKSKKITGDGEDKTDGNKGKRNGSLDSKNYYGDGTNGNGKGEGDGDGKGKGSGSEGYKLGNRKALSIPRPDSKCSNEVGVVVVEIIVDKNGNTISAEAGIKGTTITAKCLKDQAKNAALKTKWQPSPDARATQVGQIIYNFGLN